MKRLFLILSLFNSLSITSIAKAEREKCQLRFVSVVCENHICEGNSNTDCTTVKVNPTSILELPASSKAHQVSLLARNCFYSQEAKNLALEEAIDALNYCDTKFWLEHGGRLANGRSSLFFTVYFTGSVFAQFINEVFPWSRSKLASFESLLVLLHPYGINQIKVNYSGKNIKTQRDFDETIIYVIGQ